MNLIRSRLVCLVPVAFLVMALSSTAQAPAPPVAALIGDSLEVRLPAKSVVILTLK